MKQLSDFNGNWTVMLLLLTILTGGCAVKAHKSLEPELLNHSYQVTVLSKIPKEEVSIYIEEKKYTTIGGDSGLLWILIDKAINKARGKAAEERISPLLEAAADVNFRVQYWDELEKALYGSPWLKIKRLDKRSIGYTQEEIAEVKPPFLLLNTFYELSPNSQVLLVQTKASLYLNDLNKPDYFGVYTYYSDKIGKKGEKDEKAIELWAANNASAYRESLTEGIKQNMYMLRLDLLDKPADPKNEKGDKIRVRIRSLFSGLMVTIQGKVIKRDKDRVVMREKGGNLLSIGTGMIED